MNWLREQSLEVRLSPILDYLFALQLESRFIFQSDLLRQRRPASHCASLRQHCGPRGLCEICQVVEFEVGEETQLVAVGSGHKDGRGNGNEGGRAAGGC